MSFGDPSKSYWVGVGFYKKTFLLSTESRFNLKPESLVNLPRVPKNEIVPRFSEILERIKIESIIK